MYTLYAICISFFCCTQKILKTLIVFFFFLPYSITVEGSVVLDLTVLHCVDKTSSSKYLILFSAEESRDLELHEDE